MRKLGYFDLLMFLKRFRVLLAGGRPAAEVLGMMAETAEDEGLSRYLNRTLDRLRSGRDLAAALFEEDHPFPKSMARCFQTMPDQDQQLEKTLSSLEEVYRIRNKAPDRTTSFMSAAAMFMPLIVALAASLLILTTMVPEFENMYSGFGRALPIITVLVIGLSHLVTEYWYLCLLFGAVAFYAAAFCMARIGMRSTGLLYTFSLLHGQLRSGADVRQALTWAFEAVSNPRLEKKIKEVLAELENGLSVSEAFRRSNYFPVFAADALAGGEQRGDLTKAAGEIVAFLSGRRVWSVEVLVTVAFIFMAGFVVLFYLAMYIPLFSMASAVAG